MIFYYSRTLHFTWCDMSSQWLDLSTKLPSFLPLPCFGLRDNSWVLSLLGSYFYNTCMYKNVSSIPYFQNFEFVRVCSLVGRYFSNMYIVKKFEIVCSFNVKDNNIFPCFLCYKWWKYLPKRESKCKCTVLSPRIQISIKSIQFTHTLEVTPNTFSSIQCMPECDFL